MIKNPASNNQLDKCGHEQISALLNCDDEILLKKMLVEIYSSYINQLNFQLYFNGSLALAIGEQPPYDDNQLLDWQQKTQDGKEHISKTDSSFISIIPLTYNQDHLGILFTFTPTQLDHNRIATLQYLSRMFCQQWVNLQRSILDPLTGLLNRNTFEKRVMAIVQDPHYAPERAIYSSQERLPALNPARNVDASYEVDTTLDGLPTKDCNYGRLWYLAIFDIDFFKQVNDNFGHMLGDEVLLLFANLFKTSFREEDFLFRYGGEEFLVLFRAYSDNQAFQVLDRVRRSVENYAFPQVGRVTVSIGFSPFIEHMYSTDLVALADKALYEAKALGRNRVERAKYTQVQPCQDDVELF
ncbi:GGDEF domain-containing protein [Shewanella waksmanii]|uniref:GGDEF domain-containing protein n=1 Tax=Shewanella waksmanii TaxID=213783 RepID=UPI003734CDBD